MRLYLAILLIFLSSAAFASSSADSLFVVDSIAHFQEIRHDEWYEGDYDIFLEEDFWSRHMTPCAVDWLGYRSYKDWYLHSPDWS